MELNRFLVSAWLLGTSAVLAQAAAHDVPTISRHRGYTLEKKLASIPDDALPLLLKMEAPQEDVVAGESFPIRFIVTNPNRRAVRFSAAGWERPPLYAGVNDEELVLFVQRSIELHGGGSLPLLLAPGERASLTTTVLPHLDAIAQTLYADVGYTLRLRAAGVVRAIAVEEPGCPKVLCKWESEEVQIAVRAPRAHEREAYQALLNWDEAHRVPDPTISHDERTLTRIDFHRKLLNQYGDTPYANQVRLLLFRDLEELVGKELHSRAYEDEEGPTRKFFPLYVKTVSEILDSGLPYASNVKRGVLENLGMGRRWDVVTTALKKLLAMDPSERTLDDTFARVVREYGNTHLLQGEQHIGDDAKSLRTTVVRCIGRCAGWTGYRAVPFERQTFEFLSGMRRWKLLELAAQRTLQIAELADTLPDAVSLTNVQVRARDVDAAHHALERARSEREKP